MRLRLYREFAAKRQPAGAAHPRSDSEGASERGKTCRRIAARRMSSMMVEVVNGGGVVGTCGVAEASAKFTMRCFGGWRDATRHCAIF